MFYSLADKIWFVAVVLAIIENGLFNTAIVIGLIIGVLIALYRIGKT
ncbi:MAG: hypothetical protein Q6364_02605 [Candidatus Hermodarchaeota archaeon]|nr:hypothetical protein [Candidatus Hermodarchaeota archaeon]